MRFEQWLALVRTRMVLLTMAAAWALSFLTVRQTIWLDWMALVLLFWTVYQPKRISLLVAFVLGILVDVQQASRMGEHALMYVWLVYGDAFACAALAIFLCLCTRLVCDRHGVCDAVATGIGLLGLLGSHTQLFPHVVVAIGDSRLVVVGNGAHARYSVAEDGRVDDELNKLSI